jgi:hypothetical protein
LNLQAPETGSVTSGLQLRLGPITWLGSRPLVPPVTVSAATRSELGGLLTKLSSGLAHYQTLDRVLLGDRTQLVEDGAVEVRA